MTDNPEIFSSFARCGLTHWHEQHNGTLEGNSFSCSGQISYTSDDVEWNVAWEDPPVHDDETRVELEEPPGVPCMCKLRLLHHSKTEVFDIVDGITHCTDKPCYLDVTDEVLSTRHTSPKGVTWEQFQLFDPESVPKANHPRAQELAEWWMERALAEARNLAPKAVSYGSVDLDIMGEAMMTLMPNLRGKVAPQELAIAFYTLGKITRIIGALEQGVAPAADSWEDTKIYAGMALRVRETGKW